MSGGSYARYDLGAPSNADWNGTHGNTTGDSSGTNGTIDNADVLTFPTATADWGTITHIAICDNATAGAGNVLFWGALAVSKTVTNGDTFSFAASSIVLTLDN